MRWKLIIEYNGTKYAGWQRQTSGIPSVQQAVESAIYAFCQQDITIHAAGRTDAGVHAIGQVAHFDLDYGSRSLSGFELAKALNAHLKAERISIVHAELVDDAFHARFSACNKLYIYKIVNRSAKLSRDHNFAWHFKKDIDIDAMRDAAGLLLGSHDFSTFRDSECQAKSPLRSLDRFDIIDTPYDDFGGKLIECCVEARSFLHHQVRIMVGTLMLVGEGKWTKSDLQDAFEARDRKRGGQTAPSCGLYLARVDYK